ncbi:hypothetical protein [Runella aurantiaca]|uniref:Uncharacterized protein n=1 Tax=Runella aurantiaca TaxID=2282308 RepID=A0A369I7S4_9BACT|nr:hypothetical protein [Runella aurantiaca]RDB02726.1 hypothetical protein DVG78_27360 [Runella aurantiaca]
MDLGASIVGMIVILICIIPFVLISINNRKKGEKLRQKLFGFAENSNFTISRFDSWHHSSIGIDDQNSIVFFTRTVNDQAFLRQINLSEIQKCRVIISRKTASNSGEIERLELAFTYHNKQKSEVILEFYNAAYDSLTLSGELQMVEKWGKIVNDKISVVTPLR